jgi:hypothetical protein
LISSCRRFNMPAFIRIIINSGIICIIHSWRLDRHGPGR